MMLLTNARHEIAAQERAKGKSGAETYRVAYPRCSKASAETAGPRVLRNVQVKNRVAELRAETAKAARDHPPPPCRGVTRTSKGT